jgi:hypothetical protein
MMRIIGWLMCFMAISACGNRVASADEGGSAGASGSSEAGVDEASIDGPKVTDPAEAAKPDALIDLAEASSPRDANGSNPALRDTRGDLMTCAPADDVVEGCVIAPDGTLVIASFASPVTVTEMNDVAPGACPSPGFPTAVAPPPPSAVSKRIVVTSADSRVWTVVLRMPDLPQDLLHVGDVFDLTLDAFADNRPFNPRNQTLALSRGGQLLFFATTIGQQPSSTARAISTSLAAFGMHFEQDEPACLGQMSFGCLPIEYRLRIIIGGEMAVIQAGERSRIGGFGIALDAFFEKVGGTCDYPSLTQIAGFLAPRP